MKSIISKIKKIFFKEDNPFIKKVDVNWGSIRTVLVILVVAILVGILFIPEKKKEQTVFHEKVDAIKAADYGGSENNPTQETLNQIQGNAVNRSTVRTSLDDLYQRNSGTGGMRNINSNSSDHSSSMILARSGMDTKTQLPPGTRVMVKLTEKLSVSDQGMPIIGIVSQDIGHEQSVAITRGSKVLGEVVFDKGSERALITWRSIIFPDGRERPFSAIGVGRDGQVGVEGNVKSEGFKNAMGKTITRFIGAYAEGSISRGAFGANVGGNANGLRNAIAETATDQASQAGEEMKEERMWVELEYGQECIAVLNQNFSFRDPGAVGYGN